DQTDAALSGIERDAFFQELLQEMQEFQDLSLIFDDLERHPVFRRHGERFHEEDFRDIRAQAEKLLLHELKTLKR
ncbi:DNA repair exonuclease, partial [Bacillus cereus]